MEPQMNTDFTDSLSDPVSICAIRVICGWFFRYLRGSVSAFRFALRPLFAACALLLAFPGPVSAVETIPSDSIRPGMTGYGLSVFSGYEVERFEIEVIDVMHNASPGKDMILARLSGAGLEESGVIAGMSGSPVFLDGKLAGAVAYAWGFSREPIAGITPIGEMLDVWKIPARTTDQGGPEGQGHGTLDGKTGEQPRGTYYPTLKPLPVPVALSGYSPRLADLIQPDLDELGFVPVAASGTAAEMSAAQMDSMMVPGGAIGAALVDGDVSISGIGTLTWREGQKVLGFGHPMLQAGAVEIPMVGGVIHGILPSLASSFKLFSPSRPLGTITQDRLPAIAGVIGPVPDMIPVSVAVNSPAARRTYHYRVINHPSLAGTFAAVGLADVLFSTEGTLEDMTLTSEMKLSIEDTIEITVRHFSADEGPSEGLYRRVDRELGVVFENPFRAVKVTGIDFKLDLVPGQKRARIITCRADRTVVRPGEKVELNITMQDRHGETDVWTRSFVVPATAPAGQMVVVVTSRDSFQYREATRAPGSSEPRSLSGLLRLLESSGPKNELVMAGYVKATGITVGDRELPVPPPFVRAVVGATSEGEPVQKTNGSKLFEQSFTLDRAVSGMREVTLEVRR